ncbi:MAG: hypothetical protein M3362_24465 [Acidobacteriota bacterium]|nr:hypothetical protein [Acidobacteriota bacterium]
MQEISHPAVIKVSETLIIPGYVLNEDILERIDAISKQAVIGTVDSNTEKVQIGYWGANEAGHTLKFETPESLISTLDSEDMQLKSISLQYIVPDQSGINVGFLPKGKIELSAFGNALDFQFNIDKLLREIRRCDQEYGWLIRTFIIRSKTRRMLSTAVLLLSLFLFFNIGYYLYALKVGVNIDPSVIPSGNTYFKEVEAALKSADISKKLNVLLVAQLRDFSNVQDVLILHRRLIIFSVIALSIAAVFILILRAIIRLYPLSFFAFGRQKEVLLRLHRKREIWGIAVILGFVVNVVAGLVVALITLIPM